MHPSLSLLPLLLCLSMPGLCAEPPGTTRVARWLDGKACAFSLMFDDSIPSHVKTVVPELAKRGLTGTFYVNPSSGHYAAHRAAWEKDIPSAGFELANHTLSHKGGPTAAAIQAEILACNQAIHAATPEQPWPRLVSWGQPGGIPKEAWPITKDELSAFLSENHLVPRPDFSGRGAAVNLRTGADFLSHLDKAIASGAMECVIFHGVGAEWISTPTPAFLELLDGLVARRDQVWMTGHIPAHQYATERDSARVEVAENAAGKIQLRLTCAADPLFYTHPLTLITAVPSDWTACVVEQGSTRLEVLIQSGQVRYPARPGSAPVVLTRKN